MEVPHASRNTPPQARWFNARPAVAGVHHLTARVGDALALGSDEIEQIRPAALLHDIGRVGYLFGRRQAGLAAVRAAANPLGFRGLGPRTTATGDGRAARRRRRQLVGF